MMTWTANWGLLEKVLEVRVVCVAQELFQVVNIITNLSRKDFYRKSLNRITGSISFNISCFPYFQVKHLSFILVGVLAVVQSSTCASSVSLLFLVNIRFRTRLHLPSDKGPLTCKFFENF